MKKRSLALLLALLSVIFCSFSACGKAGEPTVIIASDGTIRCEVPAGWKDVSGQLNSVASIEAADIDADCYMVAIPELKDDFDIGLDLEGYNKIIIGNVTKMAKGAEVLETEATDINGNPAILTKVQGTVEGVDIMYWVCSVDFPQYYTQVMGWTLEGKAKKHEDAILSVIHSVTVQPENGNDGAENGGNENDDGNGNDEGGGVDDGNGLAG